MQAKKILLVLLLVAGAIAALTPAGCGSQAAADQLNQQTYSQIEKGMTTAQVSAIAGEPSRKEQKSMGGGHAMSDGSSMGSSMNVEYWYYQGSKGWVRIEVSDGKVTAKTGY